MMIALAFVVITFMCVVITFTCVVITVMYVVITCMCVVITFMCVVITFMCVVIIFMCIVITIPSFPQSWLITVNITGVERQVPLAGQELLPFRSTCVHTSFFNGIHISQSLVFCVLHRVMLTIVCFLVFFSFDHCIFCPSDYFLCIFKIFWSCCSSWSLIFPIPGIPLLFNKNVGVKHQSINKLLFINTLTKFKCQLPKMYITPLY